MTSNDLNNNNFNFITIEMFNAGIQEIKSEIKDTRNELMTEIRINQNDTAHIQTSVYWGFAIIGIIIAFVGIMPFRREKSERSEDLSPRNIRDIRALIREELAMRDNL